MESKHIYLLNDHKTGFSLTNKLTDKINKYSNKNINVRTFYLFWNDYNENNKYIIITRNPKEIICSGYLYHKKCKEHWAITKDGDYYDYWKYKHFTKESVEKNKNYIDYPLSFSKPISYQNKLNNLSQTEGIITEMNSAAYLTIKGMYNLVHYNKKNVLVLKYEDLVFNHDESVRKMCSFIGLNETVTENILNVSIEDNLIYQKKEKKLTTHTTNTDVDPNRYQKFWNNEIDTEFKKIFPSDIMEKLGYN